MKTELLLAALASTVVTHPAVADDPAGEVPIIAGYDAPAGCPSPDAFTGAVRAELSRRARSAGRPLQVRVTIARDDQGYTASATASDAQGGVLERTVQAPTCAEVADIAAALVALAQSDSNAGATAAVVELAPSIPQADTLVPGETDTGHWLAYSFSLGYGAFTAGPANPVIRGSGEQTTFNPAQGARLGIGVSHAFGGWRPSLELSAAYYRQGTTTTVSTQPPAAASAVTPLASPDISDRDVLQATVDVCPVRLEYRFLSLLPCGTFSMIQSRGNSGNDPELETGLGGSVRLRGEFARSFFVEALGSAVAVTSSYEPASEGARILYALSLGTTIR